MKVGVALDTVGVDDTLTFSDGCCIIAIGATIFSSSKYLSQMNTSQHQYKWLDSMFGADITHVRLVFNAAQQISILLSICFDGSLYFMDEQL